MAHTFANRLKLYRNFKALEGNDHDGIVRYYERFEEDVSGLEFDEYFDCTVTYTNALFESGAFRKHIVMADHLLETIIMRNIETFHSEDIYSKILFKEAASLFNLEEYGRSEYILKELVKINPWDKLNLRFLHTCLLKQLPTWLVRVRQISLALLLFSTALVLTELLVLRNFYPNVLPYAEKMHVLSFASGMIMWIVAEGTHFLKNYFKVHNFSHRLRMSKAEKL